MFTPAELAAGPGGLDHVRLKAVLVRVAIDFCQFSFGVYHHLKYDDTPISPDVMLVIANICMKKWRKLSDNTDIIMTGLEPESDDDYVSSVY
jgi:hypothetical protein